VVLTLYILAVFVTVEVLDSKTLSETLIPLSLAGDAVAGVVGLVLLSVGAILSFATTANAAILSASRTPYSMAKDHILPHIFKHTATKKEIPWFSILATGIFMAIVILGLELELPGQGRLHHDADPLLPGQCLRDPHAGEQDFLLPAQL
jgi:APA family basic amino acid/polyamine antiporter